MPQENGSRFFMLGLRRVKMFRKIFKKNRSTRGQNLLEFAMVIPLLLVIFMGIFDFGWVLHKQITMDNATRAAARRGAVGEKTPVLTQLMKDSTYFDLTDDQIAVSVLNQSHVDIGDSTDRTPDNYIAVEITLTDVQLVTPLKSFVSAIGTINLSSRAEFLIE